MLMLSTFGTKGKYTECRFIWYWNQDCFFWPTTFSPWCISSEVVHKNESQLVEQHGHFCWHGIGKPNINNNQFHIWWSNMVTFADTALLSLRIVSFTSVSHEERPVLQTITSPIQHAVTSTYRWHKVCQSCLVPVRVHILGISILTSDEKTWPHFLKLGIFLILSFWTQEGTLLVLLDIFSPTAMVLFLHVHAWDLFFILPKRLHTEPNTLTLTD